MVSIIPKLKIARKQQTARESAVQRLESNMGTLYMCLLASLGWYFIVLA
jgi:hypothetical protein